VEGEFLQMKRSIRVLSVLAAVSVSGLFAQPPGPPRGMGPRHIDGLAKRLLLDDTQKEKATAIYDAAGKSAKTLHTTMKQAREALTLAVQKNDSVGIDRASLQMGTLMAQEMSIQSKADAAFRQTLSADQQTKLDQMHTHGGPPGGPDAGPRPQHGHHPPPPPAE
jgi:Spy/CpxP family protein refolding chaperone